MAFKGQNLTPIGGNSRSGIDLKENSPMGWAYASETDSVADVLATGYFDSINKFVGQNQFIYASLTDNNVIFTIASVDRVLQQVVLSNSYMQPVPDGIVTANPQTGVADNLPAFSGNSALVIKDSGKPSSYVQAPADDVTNVYQQSNFGTPVSNVIVLTDAKENFMLMKEVTMTARIVSAGSPAETFNEISSTFLGVNRILFPFDSVTPTTFWFAPSSFNFTCLRLVIFDTSNGGPDTTTKGIHTFMGINGIGADETNFVVLDNTSIVNFKELGAVMAVDTFRMSGGTVNNSGGLNLSNCRTININEMRIGNQADQGDIYVNIMGELDMFIQIRNSTFTINDTESAVFINPNIGPDSVVVINNIRNNISGGGMFFKQGETGAITAFTDNSGTGSVVSVTDNLDGTATVTTNAAHGLDPFQDVVLSAMTISAYDDTYGILAVPLTTTFTITLDASAGTATGTWTASSVLCTSTNTFSAGQQLLIKDSVNYNGGAKIYQVSGAAFAINRTFVTLVGEAGAWDTGSLTGTDRRVTVVSVESIPDSKALFSLSVIDGTATTTLTTQNVFTDLNLNPAEIDLNGTELFTLSNAVTGEFRYDGVEAITLDLGGFISGIRSAGTTQRHQAIPVLNGVNQDLTLAKTLFTMNSSDPDTGNLSAALVMQPDDLIKIRIRNTESGSAGAIIQQMSFTGS